VGEKRREACKRATPAQTRERNPTTSLARERVLPSIRPRSGSNPRPLCLTDVYFGQQCIRFETVSVIDLPALLLVIWGSFSSAPTAQKVLFWLDLEHHAKTRFAAHHAVVSLCSTVQGVFFDHWQHSADLAELKSVFGIDGGATRPAVN